MATCSAPGPEGLRCDRPRHHGGHGHELGRGVTVYWHNDHLTGGPFGVAIYPTDLGDGLSALGAVLREHGDAARGAS